jgi:hypothetical protein
LADGGLVKTIALAQTSFRIHCDSIGAKVIAHTRYTILQMAEVAVSRDLFRRILEMSDDLRPSPALRC